jgi:hypothetical protein
MGVRTIFAVTWTVATVACTPAFFGQEDDLRPRIPTGCRTLDTCLQLQEEAQRRLSECQPNTMGYERCTDARADADDVQRRVARFQEEIEADQRESNRKAQAREELLAQQENEERQRRQWIDEAVAGCARALNDEPCRSANATRFDDETRAACVDRCQQVIAQGLQSEYVRALDTCTSDALASPTPATFDCRFGVADATLEARRVECAEACKDETAKLAALRPSPPAPAPRVTPTPASTPASTPRQTSGGGGGNGLLCCDGTLSPTCACPGHRGCCSHHGGVCGCQ